MCVADYQISRQIGFKISRTSTNIALPGNTRRVGLLLSVDVVGAAAAIYIGSASTDPQLGMFSVGQGSQPFCFIHLRDVGLVITQPLLVVSSTGQNFTIIELIANADLETLLRSGQG